MQQVVFESTRTMDPEAFEQWALERRCWDLNRYELLHRRIVMTPPAGYPRGEIAANVVALLHAFVKPSRLGKVFDSSQGYVFPSGDTLEPDATYVSNERWMAAAPAEPGRFLRVVPDLAVEVLSAGTAPRDRGENRLTHEANGVREYWIADRDACELVVFVAAGGRFGPEQVFAAGQRARSSILDGLEFAVADVLA